MSQKIKAIVIKSSDKKEKDASVLLFSLELGKIWVTLKGVKAPKAKLKVAGLQFAFGEFVLEEGKTGQIVTAFECLESFHELAEDIDKYFEASAVLEVVGKLEFSSENERARVFVLVLKTLKSICFGNLKNLYALDKFFIELFKICGFPLFSPKCTCCGTTAFTKLFVNYFIGELVCAACKNLVCEELPPVAYSALKILDSTDFEKLGSLKLAKESELILLRVLVKDFEAHFDTSLKLMGILS